MQLTVYNKDRFPHAYQIKKLGGTYCANGDHYRRFSRLSFHEDHEEEIIKEYYEEHEQEIIKEYKEIIETMDTRCIQLGGSKKIHNTNANNHTQQG